MIMVIRCSCKKIMMLASMLSISFACSIQAQNMPPVNPYLADSNNPIGHNSSAQQTSTFGYGPTSKSRTLEQYKEMTWLASGPFQFGQPTSAEYADGRRVLWGSGADRLVKIDHDTHAVLSTLKLPDRQYLNMGIGLQAYDQLDTLGPEEGLKWVLENMVPHLADLSGAYTLIDNRNRFIIGRSDKIDPSDTNSLFKSSINIYGDETEGDATSSIVKYGSIELPNKVKGSLVGMNMTYDGWFMLISNDGYLVAVSRELKKVVTFNIANMIAGLDKVNVRNSVAIDQYGGLFVATDNYMIKVIWNGKKFMTSKNEGAWAVEYPNGTHLGSGSTPSLMGFDDEDQFVVITDGDEHMGVALFWRNDIPQDWKSPIGVMNPRFAGYLKTSMTVLEKGTQTEQSVIVNGYGAMVVNNTPPSRPAWYSGGDTLLVGWLGHHDAYKPYGVEKFEWDPQAQQFESRWVNMDVSSLNAAPTMAAGSNMAYTVGTRGGKYTVEGIDLTTGETARTWVLGGSRFNSLYAGILIDENGKLHYTSLWGKVRLEID